MILPVGFSLLLRRWLATLLFGVLALCGGLLMSGASAEAEPTSSIQRVASYDRGSTTTPTGNTRIVAVGADRELTEAPRPYASRIALGRATRGAPGVVRGGETAATRYGREIHKTFDYGPGFRREFSLPSGRRADAVNLRAREVVELKPNNPRAIT